MYMDLDMTWSDFMKIYDLQKPMPVITDSKCTCIHEFIQFSVMIPRLHRNQGTCKITLWEQNMILV